MLPLHFTAPGYTPHVDRQTASTTFQDTHDSSGHAPGKRRANSNGTAKNLQKEVASKLQFEVLKFMNLNYPVEQT